MTSLVNSTQRPPSQLRKACNFCHESKVKCIGDSPCLRCTELDIPCRYEHAVLTGKAKGSRNRKTLEKAQRLRQEARMKTDRQRSRPHDKDSNINSSSSTSSATSEGEHSRMDMSARDDILMPCNWDSQWIMYADGGESQSHRGAGSQPGETMAWGHIEDTLQLDPLSSTELSFISDSLPPLNANPYDAPAPGGITLKPTTITSHKCTCVSHLLDNMAQLSSLTQDSCECDRFDRGMKVINNAWATIRANLQCESSEHQSQLFLSMSSCIRLACGWFQSRASLKQCEAPVSGYPPSVKWIGIQGGEFEIPHKQVHVMHGLIFHMAVQDGIDLLGGLRGILEKKQASTLDTQANMVSLTPVDVKYILSVLAHCEEEMLRIFYIGRDRLTIDSSLMLMG